MEELRVPTRRIAVEIFMDDGDHLYGSLFAPQPHHPSGQVDSVVRLLNDARRFLPFSVDGNERHSLLVNKSHVVRVRLTASGLPRAGAIDAPPLSTPGEGGAQDRCTLVLADGDRVSGWLAVHGRDSSSRLLDKLNQPGRFLPLLTDHGVELIHREYVVRAE